MGWTFPWWWSLVSMAGLLCFVNSSAFIFLLCSLFLFLLYPSHKCGEFSEQKPKWITYVPVRFWGDWSMWIMAELGWMFRLRQVENWQRVEVLERARSGERTSSSTSWMDFQDNHAGSTLYAAQSSLVWCWKLAGFVWFLRGFAGVVMQKEWSLTLPTGIQRTIANRY